MTISSEGNKNTYPGDGADTTFDFTFPILDESHIEVEVVNDTTGVVTTKTITTHYTVSGTGNTSGSTDYASGTVTFVTAPASGETVVLRYDVPITQGTDLQENDNFPAETVEDNLDKLTMITSGHQEELDRSVKLNAADSTLNNTIVKGVPGANKIIQVDSGGDDLEWTAIADISAHPVLDEDDMASDSAAHVATQQSIKAYVDSQAAATTIQVDGVTQNAASPTLDFDGTDFTLTESPTDDFDITIKAERIQDIVGAMFTGNTETLITVTYQDGDGTVDFVVDEASIDHDALTNFVANEHIDWTSTTSNLSTSGTAATGNLTVTGTIAVTSTVDGRDIATDGTKLDGIEANADVTDAANVAAAVGTNGIATRTSSTTMTGRTITGTSNEIDVTNGDGVSGNPTIGIADNLVIGGTDSMVPPLGTTGQRNGTPSEGMLRGNTTTKNLEYYDGTDWVDLTSGAGGGISAVVDDTTPQLGGQLDINGQAIGDGTNELLTFTEDASAVNHVNIENQATGSGPIISSAGDDTNVNLEFSAKGSGVFNFDSDINVTGDVGGTTIGGITEANLVDKSASEVITGSWDFGGAGSLEIPNSATPTVNADGEIAVDTTVTDFSAGVLKYYSGEEMAVVAMPIAQLTTPTDGNVVSYNATNDEFELAAGSGFTAASQAQMEAATDNTVGATPANTQYHPGVAKCWVNVDVDDAGGSDINESYNITSITDNSTGNFTVTIATDFSTANYAWAGMVHTANAQSNESVSRAPQIEHSSTPAVGSFIVVCAASDGVGPDDVNSCSIVCFGDQ